MVSFDANSATPFRYSLEQLRLVSVLLSQSHIFIKACRDSQKFSHNGRFFRTKHLHFCNFAGGNSSEDAALVLIANSKKQGQGGPAAD